MLVDHKTLYSSKHWYITWHPDMPAWRMRWHNWVYMLFLGPLGITYYV